MGSILTTHEFLFSNLGKTQCATDCQNCLRKEEDYLSEYTTANSNVADRVGLLPPPLDNTIQGTYQSIYFSVRTDGPRSTDGKMHQKNNLAGGPRKLSPRSLGVMYCIVVPCEEEEDEKAGDGKQGCDHGQGSDVAPHGRPRSRKLEHSKDHGAQGLKFGQIRRALLARNKKAKRKRKRKTKKTQAFSREKRHYT